jgi:hypothetical protein
LRRRYCMAIGVKPRSPPNQKKSGRSCEPVKMIDDGARPIRDSAARKPADDATATRGIVQGAAECLGQDAVIGATVANAPVAKCAGPSSRDGPEAHASARAGACRECGAAFPIQRHGREFCGATCRRSFHNRKQLRGAQLYDLVMAVRFERPRAEELGAWSMLCRSAASYKAADDRDRAGRRSWDGIDKVRERSARLLSTIVGTNVAGSGRRNDAKPRDARGPR